MVAWALVAVALAAVLALAALWVKGLSHLWRRLSIEAHRAALACPLELEAVERTDFSGDRFGVVLRDPQGRPLPRFRPGQHLVLAMPVVDGHPPIRRAYSLAGWSARPRLYELGVKRQGKASIWLHQALRPGARVQVLPPRGAFVLRSGRRVALVAGGIGITPMRAMLHRLRARRLRPPREAVLFYGARCEGDLAYHAEFQRMERECPWFRYIPVLSRPTAAWTGWQERIDVELILTNLERPLATDYYFCAGTQMMQALTDGLAGRGVSRERLIREAFGAARGNDDDAVYEVLVDGRTRFEFQGQPTLLHAMEEYGVPIPAECRAGHCGLCRLRIVSGRVRWIMQPEARVADGMALACCCVPASDLMLAAGATQDKSQVWPRQERTR